MSAHLFDQLNIANKDITAAARTRDAQRLSRTTKQTTSYRATVEVCLLSTPFPPHRKSRFC
jgi:hypothetical protein